MVLLQVSATCLAVLGVVLLGRSLPSNQAPLKGGGGEVCLRGNTILTPFLDLRQAGAGSLRKHFWKGVCHQDAL